VQLVEDHKITVALGMLLFSPYATTGNVPQRSVFSVRPNTPTASSPPLAGERITDGNLEADIRRLVSSLEAGRPLAIEPEIDALLSAAIEQKNETGGESISQWANRLAAKTATLHD
jgi:hypothetical protein